jgi:putative ABC transport system ATP-binding protein
MTLVLVTHDPALAARCSRQVAMRAGTIEGAPEPVIVPQRARA